MIGRRTRILTFIAATWGAGLCLAVSPAVSVNLSGQAAALLRAEGRYPRSCSPRAFSGGLPPWLCPRPDSPLWHP